MEFTLLKPLSRIILTSVLKKMLSSQPHTQNPTKISKSAASTSFSKSKRTSRKVNVVSVFPMMRCLDWQSTTMMKMTSW